MFSDTNVYGPQPAAGAFAMFAVSAAEQTDSSPSSPQPGFETLALP